ncbi:hypothetical protein [Lyngbya aestuarii]
MTDQQQHAGHDNRKGLQESESRGERAIACRNYTRQVKNGRA